jgi:hypothetical protein
MCGTRHPPGTGHHVQCRRIEAGGNPPEGSGKNEGRDVEHRPRPRSALPETLATPGQLAFDFEPSPDLAPLRRVLLAEIAHGERTLAQLQDHALLETVYRKPHVTKTVTGMLRDHLIKREPTSGPVRNTTRFQITAGGRLHFLAFAGHRPSPAKRREWCL